MLKLFSFHHTLYDNRVLLKRIKQLKESMNTEQLSSHFNVKEDQLEQALKYPGTLNLRHYIRYLSAPTCCYQLAYPSTNRIRRHFVLKRIAELIVGNLLGAYLMY